jgi:hypothetical protein
MMENGTSYGSFGTSQFCHKDTTKYQPPIYLIKPTRKERGKNDTYYGSF